LTPGWGVACTVQLADPVGAGQCKQRSYDQPLRRMYEPKKCTKRLIGNVQNLEPTGANPIEKFFKQIYSISKPGQSMHSRKHFFSFQLFG